MAARLGPAIHFACLLAGRGNDFEALNCSAGNTSPSGQLPALDTQQALVEASGSEFNAARAIVAHLQRTAQSLDRRLSAAQAAEVLAFAALLEAKLEPATLLSLWGEPESFHSHTRVGHDATLSPRGRVIQLVDCTQDQAAYGAGLPFPLNHIIPWMQRRRVQSMLHGLEPEKAYAQAAEVYKAFTERLRSGQGSYLFGDEPCSLDALLYGHLAFHRASPATAPELRQLILGNQHLTVYMDHIAQEYFSTAVPTAPPSTSEEWQKRADEAASKQPRESAQERQRRTVQEQQMRRRGWYWLGGAALAVSAYVLFSGQYVTLRWGADMEDSMDLDDDDDGDVVEEP